MPWHSKQPLALFSLKSALFCAKQVHKCLKIFRISKKQEINRAPLHQHAEKGSKSRDFARNGLRMVCGETEYEAGAPMLLGAFWFVLCVLFNVK